MKQAITQYTHRLKTLLLYFLQFSNDCFVFIPVYHGCWDSTHTKILFSKDEKKKINAGWQRAEHAKKNGTNIFDTVDSVLENCGQNLIVTILGRIFKIYKAHDESHQQVLPTG